MFLAHKDEAFFSFTKLCHRLQNDKGFAISNIRTDHGRELKNELFAKFVMNTVLNIASRLSEHLNKMELLKRRIRL